MAIEESGDSIDVLRQGGIFPAAVTHLVAARNLLAQAERADALQRRVLIPAAIVRLVQARDGIAAGAP